MATITNEEEFRAWLGGKPREVAITIAARIALRILPSVYQRHNRLFGHDRFVNDAIFAFRSTAFIWVASQSWNIPVLPSAIKIYSADVKSSALWPFTVLNNILQDKRPRMAVSIAAIIARHASFTLARDREGAQFYQSSLSNSASEFWRAIEIDTTFIDEASSKAPWKALGASSLWLDEIQSASQAELWLDLKSDLQTARADWDVWTDWYEARLAGKRPRRKDIEIFRVTLDDAAADGLFPERTQNEWEEALRARDADWEKGPAHVNALIKARMRKKKTEPENEHASIEIPPLRAAAIQPEIINNKVAVRRLSAKTSAKPQAVEALIAVLRSESRALVDKARTSEQNGDQRPADELEELFADIPEGPLSTVDLFKIAHRLEFLKDAFAHVEKEWSDLTIARFKAFIKSYQKAVDQFPEWNEFRTTATEQAENVEAASATLKLAQKAVATLSSAFAEPFIDPSVPQALDELKEPFRERVEAAQNDPTGAPIKDGYFTEDFQRSIENIAKKLAELPKIRNAIRSIDRELDRHSKNAGPILTELAKYAVALQVGQVVASKVPPTGNATLDWLNQIIALIGPLGAAAVSERKKSKKKGPSEPQDEKPPSE